MPAPRKFDHDEARRMHAEGMSTRAIAEHFGVAQPSVNRVVSPAFRDRERRWFRSYHYGSRGCVDCGRPVWGHMKVGSRMGDYVRTGRCKECADKLKATTVRDDTLLCTTCQRWLPDESFSPHKARKMRRQRAVECKACAAARRREARKNPEVRARETANKRRQRERQRETA